MFGSNFLTILVGFKFYTQVYLYIIHVHLEFLFIYHNCFAFESRVIFYFYLFFLLTSPATEVFIMLS